MHDQGCSDEYAIIKCTMAVIVKVSPPIVRHMLCQHFFFAYHTCTNQILNFSPILPQHSVFVLDVLGRCMTYVMYSYEYAVIKCTMACNSKSQSAFFFI